MCVCVWLLKLCGWCGGVFVRWVWLDCVWVVWLNIWFVLLWMMSWCWIVVLCELVVCRCGCSCWCWLLWCVVGNWFCCLFGRFWLFLVCCVLFVWNVVFIFWCVGLCGLWWIWLCWFWVCVDCIVWFVCELCWFFLVVVCVFSMVFVIGLCVVLVLWLVVWYLFVVVLVVCDWWCLFFYFFVDRNLFYLFCLMGNNMKIVVVCWLV